MTVRVILTIAAGIRKAVALAAVALLILGLVSVVQPAPWHPPSSALADPGGNGKGNGNGGANGKGGNSGEHENKGKGPGGRGAGTGSSGESSEHENKGKGPGGKAVTSGSGEHTNNGKGPGSNGASTGSDSESGEHTNNGKGPGSNGASTGTGSESGEHTNNGKGSGSNGPSTGSDSESGEHTDDGSATGSNSASTGTGSGEHTDDGEGAGGKTVNRTAQSQAGVAGKTAERSGGDYVADELVVANLEGDARDGIGRLGFVVLDEQRLTSLALTITRLRVPRQMTAPAARTLLASRFPGVLVDLNAIYRPQGQLVLPPPDYPAKLIGWGHPPDACGKGLRIGLLDTAVDAESPGLQGAHVVQRSFLPAGAELAPTEHGTAIATILVGQQSAGGAGLLPGAELAVAGAFAAGSDGIPIADVMALVGGLDWLVGSGTAVINMSFAGDANAVIVLALRQVTAGRAVVVAAAGNGGPTAPPAFPADEPGVIGVTAVDNYSQPYADANRGDYIDFAAPGVRIWTPGPTPPGSYYTGTSFAAPFVTTAVAALLANGATADADRIADSLGMTAADLGQPGKDPVFGRGLIQLANPCSQSTQ